MATRARRTPSILLVGNSVDEREAYTRALRASGYGVVIAATTVMAYEIAITQPTDVVVTDGDCAGSMTGLELTRRLRIHTRTTTVPIIVITSDTRRHDGELAIKAGADMFLQKPISGDVLREHVGRLERSGATRAVEVCVRMVLQRPRMRVPGVGAAHGITGGRHGNGSGRSG
jgi:two-component system, chemotaxis family, chemotaxis protein CheY